MEVERHKGRVGVRGSRGGGTLAFAVLVAAFGAIACGGDVSDMPAGLQSLVWVTVDEPGNPPDVNGRGAVAYPFRIGRHEVTAGQWVEFLNAKARADRDGGLWNNDMDITRSGPGMRCDIRRDGTAGGFVHTVAPDMANRPVTHVSFLDACRFCNWLHNGQGEGDTETGAYTLHGYHGTDGRRIRRNPDARYFVPTDDEWYKAAYFDPRRGQRGGYWRYPIRSDEPPDHQRDSPRGANVYRDGLYEPVHGATEVGHFSHAVGPWGTFDQAGNALEWTEGLTPPFLRHLWGGGFHMADGGINEPAPNRFYTSVTDAAGIGFRVAAACDGHRADSGAGTTEPPPVTQGFPRRPWLDPLSGRPFFPLAWFSYASDAADLDQLAAEGANLVLFVNAPCDVDSEAQTTDNIGKMRDYLDHAERVGVRVLVQIGGWYGAHMRGDDAEIARQRRFVEAIASHPALFGYQLYDEPEYAAGGGVGVEEQRRLREFVGAFERLRDSLRRWDGNERRMITCVFNLVPLSCWTDFLPVLDSFQVDRYPLDKEQAYFGHRGDWGPLMMAWSMGHAAAALAVHPQLRNPAPCMQGVGWLHTEGGELGVWRDPLYEETRYMAYSSLTVGAWGVFHWIRRFGRPDSPAILANVARLHAELRSLFPAFEKSYEHPRATVRHNHETLTRGFLTDSVADVTTLLLEDDEAYVLIVSDNAGTFTDIELRLTLPDVPDRESREARVLNEAWSRSIRHDDTTGEWVIEKHTMCFGDVNVWMIPKRR